MKRFDPFHSKHYEDDESAPTKWIDILEGRAEATLPPLYNNLIAEFSGEDEVERGRRIAKWRFFKDVNNDLTPRMSEARLCLEEQEENRLQSKNIERPDTNMGF